MPADERRSRVLMAWWMRNYAGIVVVSVAQPHRAQRLCRYGCGDAQRALRFFAIEHITAVLIAVGVLHTAQARSRRAAEPQARHRIMLKGSSAFLVCVLIGIPWPGLKQARPLARTTLFEAGRARAQELELFQMRCASCHGAAGEGDGLAAAAMEPRPRNLADATWQQAVSDEALAQVIREGGLAHGLSASMPPHPDLSAVQLRELVEYIRGLRNSAK